jgi:hypothetical protein
MVYETGGQATFRGGRHGYGPGEPQHKQCRDCDIQIVLFHLAAGMTSGSGEGRGVVEGP